MATCTQCGLPPPAPQASMQGQHKACLLLSGPLLRGFIRVLFVTRGDMWECVGACE